jgi:hypothetical protein
MGSPIPLNFLVCFFIWQCCSLPTLSSAQILNEDVLYFDYTDELPEDLLSVRSAVFVHVDFEKGKKVKEEWKPYAREIHDVFKSVGVDAIAYMNYDYYSANEATRVRYSDFLDKRMVDKLIFINKFYDSDFNPDGPSFEVIFTDYSKASDLVNWGQEAWKMRRRNYPELVREIFKKIYRAELPRENHLIIDQPEFFELDLQGATRFEEYPTDLRIDKLAIPLQPIVEIPEDAPEDMVKVLRKRNEKAEERNRYLETHFSSYPFKYGFSEPGWTDEKVWREGYTYILEYAYTEGRQVRNLLGYEENPGETGYVSYLGSDDNGIKTLPADSYVYKFYIKHLNNKNIYVGEKWDADERWRDALYNITSKIKLFK